jgi:protein gp37
MGDLFHNEIPDSFIKTVFRTMEEATWHTFLVLTKRIKRAHQWFAHRSTGPIPNIWLGTSVENREAVEERVPWLTRAPAAVRFVSAEPLLEEISLYSYLPEIEWVIVGPETGFARRKFDPDWARKLRDECKTWRTPFFFKGLSRKDSKVPKDLQIEERPDQ